MAIQIRRGAYANLDTSRLVAGEPYVTTDSGHDIVGVAKSPSEVIELATKDDLDNLINVDASFSINSNGHLIVTRLS